MTNALKAVIALLNTSDSSGCCGKYSNTGNPVAFSTADCPVRIECIASAYTRKWKGSAIHSAMS